MAKAMEMVTAMEMVMEMKPQTVPAKAMENWISIARVMGNLTAMATARPRQRQALLVTTNLEAARDTVMMAMHSSMVARSFQR
jgi:hypothetical protein